MASITSTSKGWLGKCKNAMGQFHRKLTSFENIKLKKIVQRKVNFDKSNNQVQYLSIVLVLLLKMTMQPT